MNGLVQNGGRFFLLAALVLASIAVPAGRTDAAEEDKVSPTTVAEGLKTIQKGLEEAVAAGDDAAKAHEAVESVEPVWAMIGGTIKTADERSYASFEKGIEDVEAAIKSGDATKAGGAVGVFTTAANFYVTKFPAAAGAETSAAAPARKANAAPAADRSAAAAPKPDAAAGAPADDTPAVEPGDATLARTGSTSDALAALAGLALALGGLSVIGGARRRPSPIA